MWPWAHAALGYLVYSLALRVRPRPRHLGWAVIALGVGTQLPDLFDKTLAWYVHLLPHGRSFAHSLVTGVAFVLLPVAVFVFRRGYPDAAAAFAVGYLSHLVGDGYLAALRGDWAELGYLAWPLVAPPPTETTGLLAHLADIDGSPAFLFGLALTGLALAAWLRDGAPGLATARDWLRHAATPG